MDENNDTGGWRDPNVPAAMDHLQVNSIHHTIDSSSKDALTKNSQLKISV